MCVYNPERKKPSQPGFLMDDVLVKARGAGAAV